MSEAFSSLERFIRDEMRMSHIYQPVMLLELLRSGGAASVNEIAKALLSHDASQIDYEAIRGKLYEIWRENVFQGEVEVVKRATSAPRLFGDRVMTAQSEYEGRVETTGDAFKSFDLYAAMREVASRAKAGADDGQRL